MNIHTTRMQVALAVSLLAAPALKAEVRFATDIVPTFQRVELILDARNPEYSGTVYIELTAHREVTTFSLNAENLNIQNVSLTQSGREIDIIFDAPDSTLLRVSAGTPLAAGDYVLTISFTDDFDTHATSLYRMETGEESYSFTQFEADDAREAFPCFDQPGFKFPYQMVLTVPEEHMAISNCPIETETIQDGQKRVVFQRSHPMPSYLLAIATGPFETVDVPGLSIPTRIVTTQGKIEKTWFAQETTAPILAALEEYFGTPYPYRKLDLIAVPEFLPGAMENSGAITFSEALLVKDPKATSVSSKRRAVSVMAHELAHMWFGDLVTMEWWDDLWLNESFATWMGNKVTHQLYPEYAMDVSSVGSMNGSMRGDSRPSAQAIRQKTDNVSDLTNNIGAIYRKGHAVLGMFEQLIGEKAFQAGVRTYIADHTWGNARAEHLWNALADASGQPIDVAMATFIEQPGVPLVSLVPDPSGKVTLSQTRFSNFGVDAMEHENWHIPVTLKYAAGDGNVKTQTVMLTEETMEVDLGTDGPPVWIMPHSDARGYYRWVMPADMLMSMAETAAEALTPRERVGFLGNLSALLDAGVVGGDDFLNTINRFSHDPHPLVVSAVVSALRKVEHAFVEKETEDQFAYYVRRTLGPAMDRMGFEAVGGEDETIALVRPRLIGWLADEGKDSKVLAYAESVFGQYMEDPSSVDPALIGVSIDLACIRGDRELYNECKRRFESAEANTERGRFLGAMASFRDSEIQDDALVYALEGPLRPQEFFTIPGTISSNSDEHADRVFSWLMEHYEAIAERIPAPYRAFLPAFARGCNKERWELARIFFAKPEHKAPGIESRMARYSDSVNDCTTLREREGAKVRAYLADFSTQSQAN